MNKIEQLCPDGVEYKKLAEVCKFSQGIQVDLNKQTTEYQDGKLRFIRIIDFTQGNQEPRYVDFNDKRYLIEEDDISMVRYGEAGFVCTGLRGILANNLFKITPVVDAINKRFLYYTLKSNIVQLPIKNSIKQGSLAAISFNILNFISIPIPPLPLQQEIVTILDAFTDLDASLQAELEARRKQYEHYRNQLLNFEGKEVEWKTLGEVAYYPNSRISASEVDETNYVGVENLLQNKLGKTLSNYVPTTGNLIEYKTYDILIGNIRPYLKKIWMATNNGGTNGDVVVIRINSDFNLKIIPRFLYFALSSDVFFDFDNQFAKGGKMPRGDKNAILKFKIPIPPLSEQERIVGILDKFDALLNTELPAEIAARRKQYEYYREKLLTFEPLAS